MFASCLGPRLALAVLLCSATRWVAADDHTLATGVLHLRVRSSTEGRGAVTILQSQNGILARTLMAQTGLEALEFDGTVYTLGLGSSRDLQMQFHALGERAPVNDDELLAALQDAFRLQDVEAEVDSASVVWSDSSADSDDQATSGGGLDETEVVEQEGSPSDINATAASVGLRGSVRADESWYARVVRGFAIVSVNLSASAADDGDLLAHLEEHSESLRTGLRDAYAFTQVVVLRVELASEDRRLSGTPQGLRLEFEGVGARRTPGPDDVQSALQAALDQADAGLTVHAVSVHLEPNTAVAAKELHGGDYEDDVVHGGYGLGAAAVALCSCGSGAALLLRRYQVVSKNPAAAESTDGSVEKPGSAAKEGDADLEGRSSGTSNAQDVSHQLESEICDFTAVAPTSGAPQRA